ncbi:MAG: glutamyl-tRNA reductase [Polyangiales bacterium]
MSVGVVVVGVDTAARRWSFASASRCPPAAVECRAEHPREEGVTEAVLVATCNRVGSYAAGDDDERLARVARRFFTSRGAAGATRCEHRGDAARHAFRVCASLDSLVVGEPQIWAVKEAYGVAQAAGCVSSRLARLMSHAFLAAKRVRAETGIATGQVSVASVGVDLARGIFGDLKDRRVLVLGAGKMAMGAARSLVRHGAALAVANRSFARAEALAKEHGGTAHPFTDLTMLLQHCDVVVCSTGAQGYVLTREIVQAAMKARRGRSLFIVDITVPATSTRAWATSTACTSTTSTTSSRSWPRARRGEGTRASRPRPSSPRRSRATHGRSARRSARARPSRPSGSGTGRRRRPRWSARSRRA